MDRSGLTIRHRRAVQHLGWDSVRDGLRLRPGSQLSGGLAAAGYEIAVDLAGSPLTLPGTRRTGPRAKGEAADVALGIRARDPGAGPGAAPAPRARPVGMLPPVTAVPAPVSAITTAMPGTRAALEEEEAAGAAAAAAGTSLPDGRPIRLVLRDDPRLTGAEGGTSWQLILFGGALVGGCLLAVRSGGGDDLGRMLMIPMLVLGAALVLLGVYSLHAARTPGWTEVDGRGITVHEGARTRVLSWADVRGSFSISVGEVRVRRRQRLGWAVRTRVVIGGRRTTLLGAGLLARTKEEAEAMGRDHMALIASYDPAAARS